MAIAFVGKSSFSGTGGTSATFDVPAGVAAGDVLLAWLDVRGSTPLVGSTNALPSSWVPVGSAVVGDGISSRLYKRVIGAASEGGTADTVSVTNSAGAAVKRQVTVVAYRGVDAAQLTASLVSSSTETTAMATHALPSVSVTITGAWVVHHFADPGSTSITFSAGRARSVTPQDPPSSVSVGTADRGPANTGDNITTTVTATVSTTSAIGWSARLRPSSSSVVGGDWYEVGLYMRTS